MITEILIQIFRPDINMEYDKQTDNNEGAIGVLVLVSI